jgi:hypothetical protein
VIGTFCGRPLVWHNGGVDGFRTDTLLLPEQGIGILASANLHGTSLTFAAVLDVAARLLGEVAEESWYERLRPAAKDEPEHSASSAGPDRTPSGDAAAGTEPIPGPGHRLADYAATYENPGYGELTVTLDASDGSALAFRLGEFDLEAKHRHYDTWELRYAALEIDFTVTFVTDAEGVVAEAVLPLDPTCAPTRFARRVPSEGAATVSS